MQLNEFIIKRIKYLRKQQGLSQDTLSKMANLELKYVNKIENKKIGITVTTLESIIAALGINYIEFFNFSNLEVTERKRKLDIENLSEEKSKEMLLEILSCSDDFIGKINMIEHNFYK